MTDGSSQGLFVVVAVVIFGIFVAISYMLFRDQLTPSLASIFRDSTEQATLKLNASKYYHITPQKINEDSDFIFENGKIIDYVGESKDVVIPYEINGEKVTVIGFASFRNKGLLSIVIPNTVENIETKAFQVNNLETLYMPDSITQIGTAVFESNKLTEVRISRGLTIIPEETFRDNNLKKVEIPTNIISIRSYAFSFNALEELTVPRTVTSLGLKFIGSKIDNTGNGDTLKKVRIPKELETMIQSNPQIMALYGYLNNGTSLTEDQLNMLYPEAIIEYY